MKMMADYCYNDDDDQVMKDDGYFVDDKNHSRL